MTSGSKCRHLNSAGRGLLMDYTAGYQTRSLSFLQHSRRESGCIGTAFLSEYVHDQNAVPGYGASDVFWKAKAEANTPETNFAAVKDLSPYYLVTCTREMDIESSKRSVPTELEVVEEIVALRRENLPDDYISANRECCCRGESIAKGKPGINELQV
jgi:hypothetical protein